MYCIVTVLYLLAQIEGYLYWISINDDDLEFEGLTEQSLKKYLYHMQLILEFISNAI